MDGVVSDFIPAQLSFVTGLVDFRAKAKSFSTLSPTDLLLYLSSFKPSRRCSILNEISDFRAYSTAAPRPKLHGAVDVGGIWGGLPKRKEGWV